MNFLPSLKNYRLTGFSTRSNNFNNFINTNTFIDLGFLGNYFTWHNKREKYAAIFSRLDHASVNHLRVRLYPSSFVEHLSIIQSVYAPIIVTLNSRNINYNYTGFKFEEKWLLESDLWT